MPKATILVGDVRARLKDIESNSVQTCITSPPYWGLRDYGNGNQIGLEQTPEAYVEQMVNVFSEVRRVLRDDGTLWLNLGDSYAGGGRGGQSDEKRSSNWQPEYGLQNHTPNGLKPKDLVGIPWRVAFALQADGWYLRQDIIWHKPNPMPESVRDRCTKAHEYLFMITKSNRYYYDQESINEPTLEASLTRSAAGFITSERDKSVEEVQIGAAKRARYGLREKFVAKTTRNKRSVWTIITKPFKGAHFAVMPEALVEPCVLAGSSEGDIVLDPFMGAATTGVVALRHNRDFVGVELNPEYVEIAKNRIEEQGMMFTDLEVVA